MHGGRLQNGKDGKGDGRGGGGGGGGGGDDGDGVEGMEQAVVTVAEEVEREVSSGSQSRLWGR